MSEYFEYKELSEHQKVDISGHVSGFGGCFGGDCRTANVASNAKINGPYFFANCEGLEFLIFLNQDF